ncbi:MAG: PEP-CTERM sorting domain-containing protein [Sedimentisphaerales bacterium]|jgi:hypothetical protein|nr:PEP-CTERM sorting domain-containing protein [Sedimentisphaerales bacterium]HNY77325.1 PEP-CTERM sorting domain-containing protein [Sedimentisphaerales bacterium]HOC62072.1 PEP-CTERM sorting domain-containing protein [Sedimentisphaerales bacterium]HOH63541.1 PEP-CTERM sorting domain-containing protein [Sedimentisphaerales bacterium]HPY51284.1 PEP-CTERM sorting domain-containing protein [Sedimentisphaerales bacterium]
MWRIAVIVFIAVAATGAVRAELCGVDIDEFAQPSWQMDCHSHKFPYDWPAVWLDLPEPRSPEGSACIPTMPDALGGMGCAVAIDSAGDELDRWRYVYLDRHRYRFLDVTQYNLLGGPCGCGWRWCHGVWPDVFLLPTPVRCVRHRVQPIPEPATAVLLAFGAVVLLRTRRSVGDR